MAGQIEVRTDEREQLLDITDRVRDRVRGSGVRDGVVHLWSLHTTCALTVNEGADPDVARDIVAAMRRLVPHDGGYRHAEGNSDAHIKTTVAGPGLTLLVEDGGLVLGTWQHVFLAEWDGPRTRRIAVQVMPAPAQ
ncbi:MAG TPA: secondary thiamine-phosphate synthase enzyme YjbQ [Longimicrobiales bacterium]|nr:secondary thiamine-phosphate synthase enzyme YjbQ [Longimicrobiales bacterium]